MNRAHPTRPAVPPALLIFAAAVMLALSSIASPVQGGTFGAVTVDSIGDDETADALCTLREAIQAQNMSTGYNGCVGDSAGADRIVFDLAPNAVINVPNADLPAVTGTYIIDGNIGGTGKVEIRGSGGQFELGKYGLIVNAAASIRNLVINSFPTAAIRVNGDGASVLGNRLGTDATGTIAMANGNGLEIHGANVQIGSSTGVTAGGPCTGDCNLLSGNNSYGIQSMIAATNLVIKGNFIGTDVSGNGALANLFGGITTNAATGLQIGGGTTKGEGNVISGNGASGIYVYGPGSTIDRNFIGTNAAGDMAIPNAQYGIQLRQANILVTSNVISGNGAGGIIIAVTSGAQVLGNLVGTDITGTTALPNGGNGIYIANASANQIGGPGGAGNVISGNTLSGVRIGLELSTDNQVKGNLIGLQADGEGALGNGGHGVLITEGATDNTVGDTSFQSVNRVANNGGDGVAITDQSDALVIYNEIFDNVGLGIDLGDDGVTPNDIDDADAGPNGLQNFLVILSVENGNPGTYIDWMLNSVPNTEFFVEFFNSPTCDPSGHGEGKELVGQTGIVSNANGDAMQNDSFPFAYATVGYVTAVVSHDGPPHYASEFSACYEVNPPAATPTPTPTPSVTTTPTGSPSVSPTATVTVTPTPTDEPTTSGTPAVTPTSPGETFTPPPGETQVWGDHNCSGAADPVDALLVLRHDAGLTTQTNECPEMGAQVDVTAVAVIRLWGDLDCSGEVDAIDALKGLRFDAALSITQSQGCPDAGQQVIVVP